MPLHENGLEKIRANLELIAKGERVNVVIVGELTEGELEAVNRVRQQRDLPLVEKEIVFLGRHMHQSRIVGNGYTIEEVLEQLSSAMGEEGRIDTKRTMSALVNQAGRKDGNGRVIRDRAVLECSGRNPKIELYSVVPEGDGRAPKAKGRISAALAF